MRWIIIATVVLLAGCKQQPISDFCQQVDTIGETALIRQFGDDELKAIKLTRKRALLALRRAYDTHCSNPPD